MQKNNASASETDQRMAVVAAARAWIGTPYHNCADVRGAGVDCGMLLVRVFVDTGLCEPFDPRPYPPDWHLHRAEEKYLGFIFDRAHEVFLPLPLAGRGRGGGGEEKSTAVNGAPHASAPSRDLSTPTPDPSPQGGGEVKPGDVAVFRFGRCYSHGGIVVEIDPLAIVHAYAPARCVLEERVHQNAVLGEKIRKPRFFSWWRSAAPLTRRANGLEGGMSAPREP